MTLANIKYTARWDNTADEINATINALNEQIAVAQTRAAIGNTQKANGTISIIYTDGTGEELLPPPDSPQPLTGGIYNGYEKVTGLSQISAGGRLTVVGDEVVVGAGGAGEYSTPFAWGNVAHSTNASVTGFILAIERGGQYLFSQRVTGDRASAQGLKTNLSGGGFLDLEEGDKVSVWIASNNDGTISVHDFNLGLTMDVSTLLKAL